MLSIFKKEVAPPLISNIGNLLPDGNDLLSDDTIVLNEKLSANLFCAGEVLLGCDATLLGNIAAQTCSVSGTVKGNIAATEKLELKSTAVVEGNIQAPALHIEEGAVINGRIAVTQEVASIRITLLNKINRYTADEFLSAKISSVLAEANILQPGRPKTGMQPEPVKTAAQSALKAAENTQPIVVELSQPVIQQTLSAAIVEIKPEEVTEENPKAVQKELSAAAPQPKFIIEENTEVNNRWW